MISYDDSYDDKEFILLLVLYVYTDTFQFSRTLIFSLQLKSSFSVYADYRYTKHRKHHLLDLETSLLYVFSIGFSL